MLLQNDAQYVQEYLGSWNIETTKYQKQKYLEFFYGWLGSKYPQVDSILKVTPVQFREYFQFLDGQVQGLLITKRRYRGTLKEFIYWILRPRLAAGEIIPYNYEIIFDRQYYTLNDTGTHRKEDPFSKKDVLECLSFFRERNERDYMMFATLAYTGMRVGGLVNIVRDEIDFEKRRIITQEKHTKAGTGLNEYPIPVGFVRMLKGYCLQHKASFPNEERLFPITTKSVQKQIKLWRKSAHPHLFRDAINTRWSEAGLDEGLRAILLNQQPEGVNAQHYLKTYRGWASRLELFDKFFPY